MNEEISIINSSTRNEKIKNFFINNKKKLILIAITTILIVFSFFSYQIYQDSHKEWLANKYNTAVIEFQKDDKSKVVISMKEIIEDKDRTYSPLALYFIIDNNIVNTNDEINQLFDEVLNINKLDKEIKNLVIYKKGLFNSEFENENNLIKILSPILNSNSIWKSHALFLMGEYFLDKNEKQKAKEFFEKILILENTNSRIKLETQKIIQRDLSE
jgi:predicted negative regulator of RcsB-dependent stress response